MPWNLKILCLYCSWNCERIVCYSVKRGTGNGKMKTGKKQKMDNRAKVQVCFCCHISFSGPRACFPLQDYLILLTFFSHFVCTYNICTICRRRILVETPSTLFQGCFITKTCEVCEPHWDLRGTKNSVSWKRGWMISQLSARDCGVFNVPSWRCINWTPRSSVMNLYSSHIWWVWPS